MKRTLLSLLGMAAMVTWAVPTAAADPTTNLEAPLFHAGPNAAVVVPSLGAAPADPPPTACGVVVTNTTLKTDCEGPLVIASSGVNVNLNRHTVTCSGDPSRPGIVISNETDDHVENGTVEDCRNGIVAGRGGSHTFNNLVVQHNAAIGLALGLSDGNAVKNDSFLHNGQAGVDLSRSNANHLDGLVIDDNGSVAFCCSTGIAIDFGSSFNVLTSSRIERNVRYDVYLDFNTDTGNRVESSLITDSGFGIGANSQDNIIQANRVSGNTRAGIRIDGHGNQVIGNRSTDNPGDGITAGVAPQDSNSSGNTFQGNVALGNGGFDLADYPPGRCTLNTWVANTGVKLFDGCETG